MTEALSPCVSICRLDPETGWCEGCYRAAQEIAGWLDKSEAERAAILGRLAERRRRFGRLTRIR